MNWTLYKREMKSSWKLLVIFLAVIGLLVFRFFVIFPRIACVHCRAKNICPQAQQIFKD